MALLSLGRERIGEAGPQQLQGRVSVHQHQVGAQTLAGAQPDRLNDLVLRVEAHLECGAGIEHPEAPLQQLELLLDVSHHLAGDRAVVADSHGDVKHRGHLPAGGAAAEREPGGEAGRERGQKPTCPGESEAGGQGREGAEGSHHPRPAALCDHGRTAVIRRRDRRPAQDLRPGGHRSALAAGLGDQWRLPSGSQRSRRAVLGGDPAAERDRQPAHGPCLQHGPDRHDRALPASAGQERAVSARHRPRVDRGADHSREAAQGRGSAQGRPGP